MIETGKCYVIVAGSEQCTDVTLLEKTLDRFMEEHTVDELLSDGDAEASPLLASYARERGIPFFCFLPDAARYGKAAEYKRSEDMVRAANAGGAYGVLFSFGDTQSDSLQWMLRLARERGMEVHTVEA